MSVWYIEDECDMDELRRILVGNNINYRISCELLSLFSTFGISNNWMFVLPQIIRQLSQNFQLKIAVVTNRKNPV